LEQRKSNFVFEIAHLFAQRRLRDVQLYRGARHVFLLAHGDEVTQVPQLHLSEPNSELCSAKKNDISQDRHTGRIVLL
jgi:hypothetical protein